MKKTGRRASMGTAPLVPAPRAPLVPAPRDEEELLRRARAIEGRSLGEIAALVGLSFGAGGARAKGRAGEVVERALGAQGGSAAQVDFPSLGVELKTIPTDSTGRPRESTYVCTLPLFDADRASWATSWARRKLARVLWVPILIGSRGSAEPGKVGRALLWSPTPEQEAVLAADFDEIVGLVGTGNLEALSARVGRWLQARPKAAHGRVRTLAYGPEGEPLSAPPKGFYLRARFTRTLLLEGKAAP